MSARRDLLHAGSCAWVAVASGLNAAAAWRALDSRATASIAEAVSQTPFGLADTEPMVRAVFSLALCFSVLGGGVAVILCLRELTGLRSAASEPMPEFGTERCG